MKKIKRLVMTYVPLISFIFFKTGNTAKGIVMPSTPAAYGVQTPERPFSIWPLLVWIFILFGIPIIIGLGVSAMNKRKTQKINQNPKFGNQPNQMNPNPQFGNQPNQNNQQNNIQK